MNETPQQVANHAQFLSHLDAAKIAMMEDSIRFYRHMIQEKEQEIRAIKQKYQSKN